MLFPGAKVAVFCDGDFWHGRDWTQLRAKLATGSNASYWLAKIAGNIARDEGNNILLEQDGWLVIRLWETDVKHDIIRAASLIRQVVEEHRSSIGSANLQFETSTTASSSTQKASAPRGSR